MNENENNLKAFKCVCVYAHTTFCLDNGTDASRMPTHKHTHVLTHKKIWTQKYIEPPNRNMGS